MKVYVVQFEDYDNYAVDCVAASLEAAACYCRGSRSDVEWKEMTGESPEWRLTYTKPEWPPHEGSFTITEMDLLE